MPFVEIEQDLGVWERRFVTHEERRALIAASPVSQRFINNLGDVFLAHPANMWTVISGNMQPYNWEDSDARP